MLWQEMSTPHFGATLACNPQSFPRRNLLCIGALRIAGKKRSAFPQLLAQNTANRNHACFLTRSREYRMLVLRDKYVVVAVGGVCRWRVIGESGAVRNWSRDRRSGERPDEDCEVDWAAGQ